MLYLVAVQLWVVSKPRHDLPLGTAMVVSFSLSHVTQLLIQGFFLELELLSVARLQPKLFLQGAHYPVLRFQLIHLQERREGMNRGGHAKPSESASVFNEMSFQARMKMTDTVIIKTQSFLNNSAINIVLKYLKIQGLFFRRKEKC